MLEASGPCSAAATLRTATTRRKHRMAGHDSPFDQGGAFGEHVVIADRLKDPICTQFVLVSLGKVGARPKTLTVGAYGLSGLQPECLRVVPEATTSLIHPVFAGLDLLYWSSR